MTKECDYIIAYHGTDPETAKKIIESGVFKKGTYFAFKKKHAITFGGNYVFAVKFSADEHHWKGEEYEDIEEWQFHLRNAYSTSNIVTSKLEK